MFSKAPVMPGIWKTHVSDHFRPQLIEACLGAALTRVTYDYQMDVVNI